MFVRLLRLRQICCDPRLVEKEKTAADSGKLNAFRELLAEAIDDGHRLLVFSQFVSVLQLLKAELDDQGLSHAWLDGQTRNRLAVCDRFNSDSSIPVFLISLKAGGTGLNLTGADTVVHFDPWWNPAAEAQATDRAHRIGQKKVVTSIKLIAAGSIEEKVLALQRAKKSLLEDLFEESRAATSGVSLADLRELLA
jgi:SNF2 family DNA or RNA helicase